MKHLRRLVAVLLALALFAGACGDDDAGSPADPTTSEDGDATAGGDEDPAAQPGVGDVSADDGEVQLGGELRVGINGDTPSWYVPDIGWLPGGPGLPARAMYETFTRKTESGEIVMELAESLEPTSEDFTVWTMKLRPGITFWDGSPLDAQTVVDMRLKWVDSRLYSPQGIDTATAIDELTVEFKLFAPDPALGDLLSGQQGGAFSPYTAAVTEQELEPMGTGPFVLDDWVRDSHVRVVKNPTYWRADAQPRLDAITFQMLPDRNTRHAALRSGDVDALSEFGADGLISLAEDGYDMLTGGVDVQAVVFNTEAPPLDDLRVRQALVMSVDPASVEALAALPPGRDFVPRHQWYTAGNVYHSAEADALYPAYDVAAAQALYDEYRDDAARSDGKSPGDPISFVYSCTGEPDLFLLAQLYQAEWGDVGFDVEIVQAEPITHLGGMVGSPGDDPPFSGTGQAGCFSETGIGDPLLNYSNFYNTPATQIFNVSNYNTPTIDAELAVLAGTADVETRVGAVAAIETELNTALPRMYGATTATAVVFSDKVKGLDDWTYIAGNEADILYGADFFWPAIWVDQS